MIGGGSLPRELAWVPTDSTVIFKDDQPYLLLNRSSQGLTDLRGAPVSYLKGLKWTEGIKAARDTECARIYKNCVATEGAEPRASKRKMSATIQLPTTLDLDVALPSGENATLKVLFTSDCMHVVAFHITSEALMTIVSCIRANPDNGTRNLKAKRDQRTWVSKHPEVHWSASSCAFFITWSDGDGMTHRKWRKPWTAKPVNPDDEAVQMEAAELFLHSFYDTHHKGPSDFLIPVDVCDDEPRCNRPGPCASGCIPVPCASGRGSRSGSRASSDNASDEDVRFVGAVRSEEPCGSAAESDRD